VDKPSITPQTDSKAGLTGNAGILARQAGMPEFPVRKKESITLYQSSTAPFGIKKEG
jgi:hypothetical protein